MRQQISSQPTKHYASSSTGLCIQNQELLMYMLNTLAQLCKYGMIDFQEWFHFVDKEKQVRIRIDGKVDQMIAEAAELKQWTMAEVPCNSLTAAVFA